MRHNGSYSITLAARAFSSAFFVFLLFEATHVLFEVYATQVSRPFVILYEPLRADADLHQQPMSVSQFGSNPNQVLLSGLRSSDPYFQVSLQCWSGCRSEMLTFVPAAICLPRTRHFDASGPCKARGDLQGCQTWQRFGRRMGRDLSRMSLAAWHRAAAREGPRSGALYVSQASSPPVLLGCLRSSTAASSSSSASGPTASASAAQQQQQQQQGSNRAPVKVGDVFQHPRPTLLDKFAAAAANSSSTAFGSSPAAQSASRSIKQPTAQHAQQAVSSAVSTTSAAASRVPSVLQSSKVVPTAVGDAAAAVGDAAKSAPAPAAVADVIGVEHTVARFVPSFVRARVFDVSVEYRVRNCVRRRHEVVCAIQGELPS